MTGLANTDRRKSSERSWKVQVGFYTNDPKQIHNSSVVITKLVIKSEQAIETKLVGNKGLCAPQSTAALHLQSIQATDSHGFLTHEPFKTWRFSALSDGTLDYERNRVLTDGGGKKKYCVQGSTFQLP
jgi:hypothetical protein